MKKILIITLNPAIDICYQIKDFNLNKSFRAKPNKTPGGKGINVSKVLKILDTSFEISGFIGGSNGKWLEEELNSLEINNYFVKTNSETRICISILGEKSQTEILEPGSYILEEERKEFIKLLKKILGKVDIVSINGSLSNNLPKDFYFKLCNLAKDKKIILDTSGTPLKLALFSNPYLVKPNKEELEDIFKTKIKSREDVILYGKKLQKMGGKNILISLGSRGGIFIGDKIYEIKIPKIKAVNPVGSGDASVAGFIYGLSRNFKTEDTLKFSMACGISNALNLKTGHIKIEEVQFYLEKIKINIL